MQVVDETGLEILANGGDAAANADIAALGRGLGLLQRGVNPSGDKAKLRAALHPKRRSRVMRKYKDRRVIRRLLAPPAPPAVVGPRAPYWSEHVPPQNPGPKSLKGL